MPRDREVPYVGLKYPLYTPGLFSILTVSGVLVMLNVIIEAQHWFSVLDDIFIINIIISNIISIIKYHHHSVQRVEHTMNSLLYQSSFFLCPSETKDFHYGCFLTCHYLLRLLLLSKLAEVHHARLRNTKVVFCRRCYELPICFDDEVQ